MGFCAGIIAGWMSAIVGFYLSDKRDGNDWFRD